MRRYLSSLACRTRRCHRREVGAQSLEYAGLGAAVLAAMGGAAVYMQSHGGVIGQMLVDAVTRGH